MLTNYFTTAMRAFKKDSQHFLLNVFGLSVGLGAAIIVALFTQYEFSYDRQQPDAERVYRVAQDFAKLGMGIVPYTQYRNVALSLKHSQVEDAFALTWFGSAKTDVKYQGQGYKLTEVFGATPNIEHFINMNTLAGDLKAALSTPDSLALIEFEALRIFGNVNVIGQMLSHESGQFTIRAVFADLPENTHFAFKSLAYKEHDPAEVYDLSNAVYIKLTEQADVKAFEKLFDEQSIAHPTMGKMPLSLVPLVDLHFTAKSKAEFKIGGDKQNVMICVGLSALLILIASFNFINMTVAQSTKRAKEVGVRKALGATRTQLVVQFLSESVLMSLLATVIACSLVELVLPSFNALVGRELALDYGSSNAIVIVLMAVLVGVVAGLYPALFISSFSAKRVLSGDLLHGSTATLVRKCLLVLQASISIALIISTVVMNQQLAYLQSLPLGYETKGRLVVSGVSAEHVYTKETSVLLNKLNNIEGVRQTTVLGYFPTEPPLFGTEMIWPNGEKSIDAIPITGSGFNVVQGLGLKLLAGRDFSPEFSGDWMSEASDLNIRHVGAIVTQSVAKRAGFSNVADIIGKTISDPSPQFATDMKVVGVVADVIIGNGQTELIYLCGYPNLTAFYVMMTIDMQNLPTIEQQVVQLIGEHTHSFEPKVDLLVDSYRAVYRDDERISQVVSISTYLAIFLSMLGTFGLAAFSVLRRQKEVAVRKVLGASVLSIVNLLAKEFLLLVTLGIVFAFPVSYWFIADWLTNFNHTVEQSLWVYLGAAGFVGAITWLTVASLGFKAASTRPSLILRYE